MQIILIEGIYVECLPNILDHHAINDDLLYLQMYQKISLCLHRITIPNIFAHFTC